MSWANALFKPRAVAVVGSVGEGKIGRVLITQLLDGGFADVVAVNPKAQGTREVPAVASLADLPQDHLPIDLVIVASPAATVASVLEDAGAAGAKAAVIITAGFSEIGQHRQEHELLEIARRYDMRLIGPNCAGIVNTKHNLFPTLETRPPVGDVAFISQSGALGGAVLSWAEEQGVGLSKFVSYGNAVDLSEIDLLDYLRDDDESKVVALYIESVSDGRGFMEVAQRLAAVKPLVVIKSGRSDSGSRATLSHTGSLAGADAVYDAALAQCGAIRVSGIEEMFDLCRGFVHLPPVKGKRIAIVTNSGGPGVLAADEADDLGLQLASPSASLLERLKSRLPAIASLSNPFDLTVQGTEDDYRNTLVEALSETDAAIAINVNTPYLDVSPLARGVVAASQETGKPIASSFIAGEPARAALPILEAGGVPNFVTGERCARVLAWMEQQHRHREALRDSLANCNSFDAAQGPLPFSHGEALTEPVVMDWLDTLDIPTMRRVLVHSASEAIQAAAAFGGRVAMKIVSPMILHKTDVGGVFLHLESSEEIEKAFAKLTKLVPAGAFRGALITPMVERPVEAIIGLSTDLQFGSVIAVGLGGIYTEIFNDIALRVAPVSVPEAHRMIDGLKGIGLLKGARGSVLRDISSLAQLVSDVSKLPFLTESVN